MPYNSLTPELIRQLTQNILPGVPVFIDDETLEAYSHDEAEDIRFLPACVVKPQSTAEVAALMQFASLHQIPVTPSGARTGLSGGAIPACGGINLSFERMNQILHIDDKNMQVTVEPGVINQVLHDRLKELGLFYPPDPSSWGSCFIGGNIAYNSGGPKAVKYGVTKDYVLNLEVVLPSGQVIWTGANVLKNSTGYNLTQLMVGSEGTLGLITKAVLRLIPYPRHVKTLLVPFASPEKACEAVAAVFNAGITPCAMEFMERDALEWTMRFMDEYPFEIKPHIGAHLIIEVDGNHPEILMQECEQIAEIVGEYGADEVLFADDSSQREILWKLRRRAGEAVKKNSVYKEEDTVVPRFAMPLLLKGVKEIGHNFGFRSVCYGHVGDGNLHVNIIKGDMSEKDWHGARLKEGIREIFKLCKSLGGTISGEHGIGLVQREFLPIAFSPVEIRLQQEIKKVFDPLGILNPGKIFPD
jgi:glycolate oxidase